jgi:hypothetical protein
MKANQQTRRGVVFTITALCGGLCSLHAFATDTSEKKPILTITGKLALKHVAGGARFDLDQLRGLPLSTIWTRTPWYPQPRKFTGVLIKDLLLVVGANGNVLKARALNDYRVEIPADDLTQNGALLAYSLDDKPIPVREKGPLLIIYPFDEHPELRTALRFSRAIWQLNSLEIE